MLIPKIPKLLISLAILLLVFGNIFAQSEAEPYFFMQVTDPQFGMFENNAGFEKETILYQKAIDGINSFNTRLIKGKLLTEEKAQCKWLKKKLGRNKQFNNVVVFCHCDI